MYRQYPVPGCRRPFAAVPLAGLLLAAAAFGFSPGVRAGDRTGEAVIGDFHIAPAPPSARSPAKPSVPSRAAVVSTEVQASNVQAGLYHDALLNFEAGRLDAAERLFERAIAAAPDTPIATTARRRLGELYRLTDAPPAGDPHGRVGPSKAAPTKSGPAKSDAAFGPPPPPRPAPAQRRTIAEARPIAPAMRLGAGATAGTPLSTRPGTPPGTLVTVSEPMAMDFLTEAGDRVFFSTGSAELGGRARFVLAAQARWLMEHPQVDARIEGHADDPPLRPEDQERLSEDRAEAVRLRLVEEGIAPERLGIVPWGREQRIADCDGAPCGAQNRRAITVLVVEGRAGPKSQGSRTPSPAPDQGQAARMAPRLEWGMR